MAANLNYTEMAHDIVRLVGGAENVVSLGHCMTRLRFVRKNESYADTEQFKAVKGVLGVVSAGVLLQFPAARASVLAAGLLHGEVLQQNHPRYFQVASSRALHRHGDRLHRFSSTCAAGWISGHLPCKNLCIPWR